jgi:hypothetical protein
MQKNQIQRIRDFDQKEQELMLYPFMHLKPLCILNPCVPLCTPYLPGQTWTLTQLDQNVG